MSRLLIADDHPIFLDGLRQFLSTNDHMVTCCARTPSDALSQVEGGNLDMLILDVSMSEGGGLHVLRTLRAAGNSIPVIFLTVGLKPAETLDAIKRGVNGIVLKHSDPNNLLACIQSVGRGETWIDPTIIERVLRRGLLNQYERILPSFGLTRRQEELVRLVGQGLRNREIAEQCGLTEGTVKIHLHNVFTKLGIRSRSQLILMLAEEAQANAE
jgi:two-component system nitrate/nitrite response regulator NarP